jgi:monoamine oxidase
MLREAGRASADARARHVPVDEVTEERAARASCVSRRDMLRGIAIGGVALVAGPRVFRAARRTAHDPRVVVVGAGIAGLGCAYRLWSRHGIPAMVFEYDDRAGGRIHTLRGYFDDDQIVEQHGEFLSSEHTGIRSLAESFGLSLDDAARYPPGTTDVYRFGGRPYTQTELNRDWHQFGWRLFRRAVGRAPFPTTFRRHTAAGLAWDRMSVTEWVERNVPGGTGSPFGALCLADVIGEYGGPPEDQSALNLVYLLGYDASSASAFQPRREPVLAGSDERFHVHGGNDQLISGLVDRLPPGSVRLSERLVALRRRSTGRYVCTFDSGARAHDVVADQVVLALPFPKLREVDLRGAGIQPRHLRAIREQPLGSNSKVQLQFGSRVWNEEGYTANALTDDIVEGCWEVTNYQPGSAGIIIDYPGGQEGASLGRRYGLTSDEGPAPRAMVRDYLAALERIFPGLTAAFNGKAYYQWSPGDTHVGGAYSYLAVGQSTAFNGIQGRREGNLHFAGEHTSLDFQGYMEGALRSGYRVAGEVALPGR